MGIVLGSGDAKRFFAGLYSTGHREFSPHNVTFDRRRNGSLEVTLEAAGLSLRCKPANVNRKVATLVQNKSNERCSGSMHVDVSLTKAGSVYLSGEIPERVMADIVPPVRNTAMHKAETALAKPAFV